METSDKPEINKTDKRLGILQQFVGPELVHQKGETLIKLLGEKSKSGEYILGSNEFMIKLIWTLRDLHDEVAEEVEEGIFDINPLLITDATKEKLSRQLSRVVAGHEYLEQRSRPMSMQVKDDLYLHLSYGEGNYEGFSRVTIMLSDDQAANSTTAFHVRGNPELGDEPTFSLRAIQPMIDHEHTVTDAETDEEIQKVRQRQRLVDRFMRGVNGGNYLDENKRVLTSEEVALILAEAYLYSSGIKKIQGISTEYFDNSSDGIGKFDADNLFGEWLDKTGEVGVEYPWSIDFSHGIYFPHYNRLSPYLRGLLVRMNNVSSESNPEAHKAYKEAVEKVRQNQDSEV